MFRSFLYIIIFSFLPLLAVSQDKDEQLAAQFLSNNEFDKAADLYEKLLNRNSRFSIYFYDNLLKCYISMKHFDDAEKLVKKQMRRNDKNAYFPVDLGYIYQLAGKSDKARKQYETVLKELPPDAGLIHETAGAFLKRDDKDHAIEIYLKGRKLLHDEKAFAGELAPLYAELGLKKETIEEFLNAVQANEQETEEVQGYLQNYFQSSADFDLLKAALIKRIKSYPDRHIFNEMLVWMYVQRKDFDNALVQIRAIDRKFHEEGRRLIDLGNLAISNERYEAAVKIFNDVVQMGKDRPNYLPARLGILEAQNKKVVSGSNYTREDLKNIEKNYVDFLNEFGKSYYTASSQRELARLQALYLYDYPAAIANFEELINLPRIDRKFVAECKLELGDIYVLKGDVWEAMLLYGQVDKDFLEEPLGQEAKFRNARLSYYVGEFAWAKAQLDVLKTATTQLIANNAIELSLLIQDNTLDSDDGALLMFARADLNYFQNNTNKTLEILDSIGIIYPKHALADDIAFKKAQTFLKKKNYSEAIVWFQRVVDEHGADILGDNALFSLAALYERQLDNKEKAKQLYEQFLEKYPGSIFVTEARKRFRFLRGDVLN